MSPTDVPAWQTGLTIGAAGLAVAIGKWLVTRAYFKPVSDVLPAYPIVLRPHRWMVVLSYVVCGLFTALAVGLFIAWLFQPLFLMKVVGVIFVATAGLMVWGAYQWAHEYIVIDADGFTYVKSRAKSIAVKGACISTALPSGATGNLVLDVLYRDKKVLIPLTFQNMNLLQQQIERWQSEARALSFHNWRPKEVN